MNVPGVCVWAAVHAGGLIGPYFSFTNTVNMEVYREVLMDLYGALQSDPQPQMIVHFQQDGAFCNNNT